MTSSPTLIFTGGHHTGALEVAKKLQQSGVAVIWLGHRHSLWGDRRDSAEYREVTASGFPFYDLQAGKLYRTFNPLKLFRLPWGFVQSFALLLALKIRLGSDLKGIVSFGGYLAVPVVCAGWLLGLPALTHEQTLTQGWANRFISRFVKKNALSWPAGAAHYPAGKTVVTGLPLRPWLLTLHPRPTVPPTIYITGGKQGSHVINQAVFAALPELLAGFQVVHQTGDNSLFPDHETALKLRSELPASRQSRYRVFSYLTSAELAGVFSSRPLVISRSGAHIIYELMLLKLPCVLIPLPRSSHAEQLQNAELLVSFHQAVLLPQSGLTPRSLLAAVTAAGGLQPDPPPVLLDGLDHLIQLIKQELL